MHHATPGAGRRLALHIAIVTVVGVSIITLSNAYQPALLEWAASDPARMRGRAQLLIAAVGVIVVAPLVSVAAYMWRLGGRTIREARFPPEGMQVIRDVPVARGADAARKGRVLRTVAAVMGAIAFAVVVTLWRIATLPPQR